MNPLLKRAVEKALIPAGRWLIKQVGLEWIVRRVEGAVEGIGHCQKAILKARSLHGGRFGSVIIEDRVRWVVYADDEPRAVFPGIRGNLAREMVGYDLSRVRGPDEVNVRRARTWAITRFRAFADRLHRSDGEVETGGAVACASPARSEPGSGKTPAPAAQSRPAGTKIAENDGSSTGTPTEHRVAKLEEELGHAVFDAVIGRMPDLLSKLSACTGRPVPGQAEIPAAPGVYLFSEGPTPLYVGNTRNLRQRLKQRTRTTSRENQAGFAWQLALRRQSCMDSH